jgi:isopentenyl-diphosphate delta-isomerase
MNDRRVSFDDEPLIVVDEQDNILGFKSKADVHKDNGILHRAFSVFLFNDRGEILMQRRGDGKLLWPDYWSNSCCSHPRRGEALLDAVHRRVPEELGVTADVECLFRFQYYAPFGERGSERELCSVFFGRCDDTLTVNETEISEWEWTSVQQFESCLARWPHVYTPWLKLEWARIREEHWDAVERYTEVQCIPSRAQPGFS